MRDAGARAQRSLALCHAGASATSTKNHCGIPLAWTVLGKLIVQRSTDARLLGTAHCGMWIIRHILRQLHLPSTEHLGFGTSLGAWGAVTHLAPYGTCTAQVQQQVDALFRTHVHTSTASCGRRHLVCSQTRRADGPRCRRPSASGRGFSVGPTCTLYTVHCVHCTRTRE